MEICCQARHPPIITDHHDTPAVTGGLHPLLDISPKNRSRTAGKTVLIFNIRTSALLHPQIISAIFDGILDV